MNFSFNKSLAALSVAALLAMTSQANAGLIKSTDGNLIYDDISDVTWLADVQYAKTSGYVDDSRMDWTASMDWANSLEAFTYSDWRLPTLAEGQLLNQSSSDFGLLEKQPGGGSGFWSSTEFENNNTKAYIFKLDGITNPYSQGTPLKADTKRAWAVTSGDVAKLSVDASVPEPSTIAILSLGLVGLAYRRKQLQADK